MPKDNVIIPIPGPAEATEEFVADAPQVMDTPTPTEEPTQVAAEQPKKKKKNKTAKANAQPPNPEAEGRWIEVDLSDQRTYAYQNNEMVRSFVVSTGTWQHPTVTGSYRIYVKYRAADMSGSDYYLPDVPYVMYFYKGYGLHGTYWHNNFGTPMSHGCVNLSTDDAAWLFDFASVGTLVQVHQ
jgi:lipoprotein-anchoring transpeptidase ErfK/SrfK